MVLAVTGDECTLGRTDLTPKLPNANPGLFIDRDSPAPCSGQIINWKICHYNSRKINRRNTLQIFLQTWRNTISIASRISSYSATIDIPLQPNDFQCVNITVDPADYVDVQQGDFVGVYTFFDAVLPVVGITNDSSRVWFVPTGMTIPTDIQPGTPGITSLTNQAIHVTATIGKLFILILRNQR